MIDLNQDPGRGNLNVRAYFASVVGPRRIAQGRRTIKNLTNQRATELVGQVSGVEVMYFEIWLPQSSIAVLPGGGAFVSFSSSEATGQNAFQLLLSSTQRYAGVLLEDDQVFAQCLTDALGAPITDVAVCLSSVVF